MGVIFTYFAIVRLSQKSPRRNNILHILLWKLHWYREINIHVLCLTRDFRNFREIFPSENNHVDSIRKMFNRKVKSSKSNIQNNCCTITLTLKIDSKFLTSFETIDGTRCPVGVNTVCTRHYCPLHRKHI